MRQRKNALVLMRQLSGRIAVQGPSRTNRMTCPGTHLICLVSDVVGRYELMSLAEAAVLDGLSSGLGATGLSSCACKEYYYQYYHYHGHLGLMSWCEAFAATLFTQYDE